MERVRTLIVVAGLLLPLGCATTGKQTANATPQSAWEQFQHRVQQAAGTEAPPTVAATDFVCAWQNRLQQLPDPSRGGQLTTGIVGQVFLYSRAESIGQQDYQSAEVTGDLVLVVSDATPLPAGVAPQKSEVWHFTKETLKKMSVTDERFGKCLILFLPWPDSWKNVNRLSIQGRYDQAGGNTLFAKPMTLTLDLNNQFGVGTVTNSNSPAQNSFVPVPDPRMVMQKMNTPNAPTGITAVQQTGAWSPPPAFDSKDPVFAPPPANMAQQGQWAPPSATNGPASTPAEFKRTVIQRH